LICIKSLGGFSLSIASYRAAFAAEGRDDVYRRANNQPSGAT